MDRWTDRPERTDPAGVALSLDGGITGVEEDFFDLIPTISSLWIENPQCVIHMTEKTAKLFRDNRQILRGVFDSAAEELARGYGLRFLHLDHEIARVGDYFDRGSCKVTLCFTGDASSYLHVDWQTQGISAGSMGGAETALELPDDFFVSMSSEEVADMCPESCFGEIVNYSLLQLKP